MHKNATLGKKVSPLFWNPYEASMKRQRIAQHGWMQSCKWSNLSMTKRYQSESKDAKMQPKWNDAKAQKRHPRQKGCSPVLESLRSLHEASAYSSAWVDAILQMEQSVNDKKIPKLKQRCQNATKME